LAEPLAADLRREVGLAQERLAEFVVETPLLPSSWVGDRCEAKVLLKMENEQVSGSFKFRGAVNKALAARSRGTVALCTASTGNHAIALANACALTGLSCAVILPRATGGSLIDQFESLGANVELVDGDILSAELTSRGRHDPSSGVEFASPYNDIEVIAGHSTLGVELVKQLGQAEPLHVVCSTGGGGLAAGLKLGLQHAGSCGLVHSIAPSASPVLARGVQRGWLIEENVGPTICYGTAGNVELDSITLSLCAQLVDSWTEVDETDIVRALEAARARDQLDVDGSAAATLAGAVVVGCTLSPGSLLVAIICGRDRQI